MFEEVEVLVNYTYTDFKYSSYSAKTFDPIGNLINADYTNNIVPAVPKHLFAFIAEHEFELFDNFYGLLQFDCDYVTKMFTDDQNTESTGSYFYVNPMAGINFVYKKFSALLSGGVKNIFNKRYVGFISINANPEFAIGQRRYYEPGEPRSYFINLNLTYRY